MSFFLQDSLKKLDDAHRLINVHLHNAARYRDDYQGAEQIQKATYDKLEATAHQLTQTKELLEATRQECRLQGETQTANVSFVDDFRLSYYLTQTLANRLWLQCYITQTLWLFYYLTRNLDIMFSPKYFGYYNTSQGF